MSPLLWITSSNINKEKKKETHLNGWIESDGDDFEIDVIASHLQLVVITQTAYRAERHSRTAYSQE